MNWFRKYMQGRYGSDQLSMFLTVISFLVLFISNFKGLGFIMYLGYIPLVFVFVRMFSKNIEKRRMENYKFSIFISPLYSFFKTKMKILKDMKTHRYFKCPKCKQKLRVPKNKGKISITCTNCKNEFVRKT